MDIILLAAIAAYIFFRLHKELGKVDEEQKRDAIRNFIKEQTKADAAKNNNAPKLVAIPGAYIVEAEKIIDEKSQKILNSLDESLRKDVAMVLEKIEISANDFLNGAIKAFEMVIENFASDNITSLKPILSEKIYQQFEAAIKIRKDQNQILNTKILSIDKNEITSAKMVQNFANISVKFVTKQINYVTDNAGAVISGSKEDVNEIIDIWNFKKDSGSSNPNWFISSTEN